MIGDQIKAERKARGWTQEAFAKRTGLSWGYIRLLETNRRPNPSAETLRAVAQALDVPIERLLEPNANGTAPAGPVYARGRDVPGGVPAGLLLALERAAPRLTAADWARVQGYVERLAEERGADA